MKKLLFFVPFICMVSVASGKVSTRVCLADGNTPLPPVDANDRVTVYPDIMVGTKLTIIVDSNVGGNWGSDLTIEGEYRDYGLLSARDFNEVTDDWEGSRFEAAGYRARVRTWVEAGIQGFSLDGHTSAVPGDWFIIDYTATDIGACKVGFYDRSISWDYPVHYHVFSHVPMGDIDKSTKVDFSDFAILASYWQAVDCNEPYWCEEADLDKDRNVDFNDVKLLADHWLEKLEKTE